MSERFASLLRQYRLAAGLSQEALAERSGLSARGVSNLERGISRAPYPSTVGRLADALGLDRAARAELAGAGQSEPAAAPELLVGPAGLLPRERNSFVGRTTELGQLTRLLDASPLVTLAGPGGAGKTRLALHLAHALEAAPEGSYPDGVRLVELAPVTDPALVERTVAGVLGITEERGRSVVETVVAVLHTRQLLLVLDNCEHVVAACAALVDQLLRACPGVVILATSREPLAVLGEVIFRVPPLGRSEAVELFVQRAQAMRPEFVLDANNTAAVGEICRRLDGLPLAIELAASQVAALAPADIAARLDRALRTPGGAPRTVPLRQQTLEAALAWSYDLLDEDERRLFERLTVFAGGFALDGAEAMGDPDQDAPTAVETLRRLVARSMVQLEPQDNGGVRYRVLEPLRQFGHARLVAHGEAERARRRQAEYVLNLAEQAGPAHQRPDMLRWWRRLEAEWDNLRAAHDWADEQDETDVALRLGSALWWWWTRPDLQGEGRARLERALAMPSVPDHAAARGRVIGGLAFLTLMQSDMAAAASLVEVAQAAARANSDAWLEGLALLVQSMLFSFQGDLVGAEQVALAGRAQARQTGLAWLEARHMETLGHLALARGDPTTAETQFRASQRLAQSRLDPWSQAMALTGLGDVLRSQGDVDQAGPAYEAALASLRALDPRGRGAQGILHNLAYVALGRGQLAVAAGLFQQSAERYIAGGADRRGVAECVMGLAGVAVRSRQPALAARLYGAAEAALEHLGTNPSSSNRADTDRGVTALRAALPADQFAAAWAEGRELSLEEALREARRQTAAMSDTRGARPDC